MITILLVDDQPELLDIARIFLEKEGDIVVDTASSAETAFEMLKEKKYDAVVSDYNMPGMDGIEFLHEFMNRAIDKPFIIFTGRSREDLVIRALNSGADFYLQKSGEPKSQYAELRNMVHQAVKRQRAEEALIRSEINHRTIVEAIDDSIYMVDKNCRYLFMNAFHQDRLGIRDNSYTGRHYSEFHTPEESERFAAIVRESFESGKSVLDEYQANNRWFIRRINPIRNEALERIFAVTVISAETTSRKRVEETLRITDEQYRIVVEATQDSIYTVDPDGRYLFMNSHHRERLGIRSNDYSLRSYREFHTAEENEAFLGALNDVIRTGKSREDSYQQKDRSFVRRMYPVFDASGSIIAISVISLETTGRPSSGTDAG